MKCKRRSVAKMGVLVHCETLKKARANGVTWLVSFFRLAMELMICWRLGWW